MDLLVSSALHWWAGVGSNQLIADWSCGSRKLQTWDRNAVKPQFLEKVCIDSREGYGLEMHITHVTNLPLTSILNVAYPLILSVLHIMHWKLQECGTLILWDCSNSWRVIFVLFRKVWIRSLCIEGPLFWWSKSLHFSVCPQTGPEGWVSGAHWPFS